MLAYMSFLSLLSPLIVMLKNVFRDAVWNALETSQPDFVSR